MWIGLLNPFSRGIWPTHNDALPSPSSYTDGDDHPKRKDWVSASYRKRKHAWIGMQRRFISKETVGEYMLQCKSDKMIGVSPYTTAFALSVRGLLGHFIFKRLLDERFSPAVKYRRFLGGQVKPGQTLRFSMNIANLHPALHGQGSPVFIGGSHSSWAWPFRCVNVSADHCNNIWAHRFNASG